MTKLSKYYLNVHYYLENNQHSMDAFVRHSCEHEILQIIKEVTCKN